MPPVLALLLVGMGVAAAAAAGPAPARALQVQLDAAIRQRASLFTIPAGVYNFTTDSFNISGATNLRVAAAGDYLFFRVVTSSSSWLGVSATHSTPSPQRTRRGAQYEPACKWCVPRAVPRPRDNARGSRGCHWVGAPQRATPWWGS